MMTVAVETLILLRDVLVKGIPGQKDFNRKDLDKCEAEINSISDNNHWPNIPIADYKTRIKEIVDNPNDFDQVTGGFCGPAAFWYVALQRFPKHFVDSAKALYETGKCKFGEFEFDDSTSKYRQYDFIDAKLTEPKLKTDLLFIGFLQDALSFSDFNGRFQNKAWAPFILDGSFKDYFSKSGFYKNVELIAIDKIKLPIDDDFTDVLIAGPVSMFGSGFPSDHIAPVVSDISDKSFYFWTSGIDEKDHIRLISVISKGNFIIKGELKQKFR